jgi:hypothetical protein
MTQLSASVQTTPLRTSYLNVMRPLYQVNWADVRFGWSNRQPLSRGLTDCTTIYFSNERFVTRLRAGLLDTADEYRLLFHELTHAEQCGSAARRDRYARMWFDQLSLDFIKTGNLRDLHDAMPMEAEAIAREAVVLEQTRTNRDHLNHLVEAIRVGIERNGSAVGVVTTTVGRPIRFDARATGGSPPITFSWTLVSPTANGLTTQTSAGLGQTVEITPSRIGEHVLHVKAEQQPAASNLEPARNLVTIRAVAEQVATGAVTSPPPIRSGAVSGAIQTTLNRTLTVTVLNAAGSPLQASVCVGDSSNADRHGLGVAGRDGKASFEVQTGRAVRVTAHMPGYIGQSKDLTMPADSHSIAFTLRPGVGGTRCQ